MKKILTLQLLEKKFKLVEGDFLFHGPGDAYMLNAKKDSIVINLNMRRSYIYKEYPRIFKNYTPALRFFDRSFRGDTIGNYMIFHSDNRKDLKETVMRIFIEYVWGDQYQHVLGDMNVEKMPTFYRICVSIRPTNESCIHAEVWIPDENWDGRFLGIGNGGAGEFIWPNGMIAAIKCNYACACMDMGTNPDIDNGIGVPEIWDYDGILAKVPGNNRVFLHTYLLWLYRLTHKEDGQQYFSDTDQEYVGYSFGSADYLCKMGF